MAKGYFTVPISEHREETPEGFLIARDCVIARTGWQTYKVGDLPQESAVEMGVDVSNKAAEIDLYRPAEEVFHPDTLRSFEGKVVTDNHPKSFVDPVNFNEHARGHVQNIRRGKEPLESGDWPMLGDVHVMAEPLLSKVRNKLVRELSCGYDYSIRKDGDKICQIDIIGNHVAVVPKGRAGNEARINDSAAEPTEHAQTTSTATAATTPAIKEKKPVKSIRNKLLGLGFKVFAADAEPEELAEAAKAMHEEPEAESKDTAVKDAAVKDASKANGVQAKDRKPFHDALDRALDECGVSMTKNTGAANDTHATDVDMSELKNLMDEYFGEEKEEPEHAEDEEEKEEEEEEEEEEESEAEDEDEEEKEEEENKEEKGKDRAGAADGAEAVLKLFRPFVARSNDEQLKGVFNTALGQINRTSKVRTGGYGKFGSASRALDSKTPKKPVLAPRGRAADGVEDRNANLQQAYDAAIKGGK